MIAQLSINLNSERSSMYERQNDRVTMALLVGLPGSGKTTHWLRNLRSLGYERIAPQSGTSYVDCLEAAIGNLRKGKSIVIGKLSSKITQQVSIDILSDDILHTRVSRRSWIDLGRTHGVLILAIRFLTPPKLCLHNDAVRALGNFKVRHDLSGLAEHHFITLNS